MISHDLVDKLHTQKVIDKRFPFWWQLGFEGRQVLTQEEFSKGLREISYWARDPSKEEGPEFQINTRLWVKDSVPIVLQDADIGDQTLPCFITVCPMSHERGWKNFEYIAINFQFPPNMGGLLYHQPHIRGIAVEANKDFLFWYPFLFGKSYYYNTTAKFLPQEDMWVLADPVHSTKFYQNLVRKGLQKGKRAQQKPEALNLPIRNLEIVPYFEFNPQRPHIMAYPLPVFEGDILYNPNVKAFSKINPQIPPEKVRRMVSEYPFLFHIQEKIRLEPPIIVRSSEDGKADLLGAGYLDQDFAYFWRLNQKQHSIAKQALKERLGLETSL